MEWGMLLLLMAVYMIVVMTRVQVYNQEKVWGCTTWRGGWANCVDDVAVGPGGLTVGVVGSAVCNYNVTNIFIQSFTKVRTDE